MSLSFISIILLLLSITPLHFSLAKKCLLSQDHQVHIINKLPSNSPQLKIHCASKDDDLGDHYPTINEDFNWSFCQTVFGKTLFFCHFWWGSKDKVFDVYNDPLYCVKQGKQINYLDYCKWEVREDGFYLEQFDDDKYYMERIWGW
ncbi:unnamed protein product [Withania somnifera]